MADKKAAPVTERIYTIPMRREWLKVPKYRRAKKAVSAVRQFLVRNMKSEDVRIGKYLNLKLWEHGIKNPPHHVKVRVTKDDKDVVRAELFDAPAEKKATVDEKVKKAEKKEEAKEEEQKAEEKKTESRPKPEEKKSEEKKTEAKPAEKKEEKEKPSAPEETKAAKPAAKKAEPSLAETMKKEIRKKSA